MCEFFVMRSAASASASASGAATTTSAVDPASGLRVRNRTVSGAVVRARFAERRLVGLRELEKEPVGSYGFVGCVSEANARVSADGRAYGSWTVSELRSGGASVSVSVFGDAFDASECERAVGMIYAVFDANWHKARCVNVRESGQLLKIGAASDFALCKATRRDGQPCTKAVNVSECKFCEFHVPKAIREVANTQRVMTGKRNANEDFKAGLQKYGATQNKAASHMSRPGAGTMSNGAPAPSSRAREILRQTGVGTAALPRAPFQAKRPGVDFGARASEKRTKTVALDDEDLEFEDDEATLAALEKQHASSIAQARKDADLAKQRAVAERLRATGLTLEKPDPNDVSVRQPSVPVRSEPKPLPEALKAHGLQTATVEQLEKKLAAETARRIELERENAELKRQLAEALGRDATAQTRPAMRDVSNGRTTNTFGIKTAPPALKSRYASDAMEEDVDMMMNAMDALEERDQLAAQLAMKRESKVKVYHCSACQKKTRFFDASTCVGHRDCVKHVEAVMRYFKCKGCNQTNTTYDALMPKNCERNGCTSIVFERVTAADVTAAAKPRKDDIIAAEAAGGQIASREALAPRGVEHGFRLDTIHGK